MALSRLLCCLTFLLILVHPIVAAPTNEGFTMELIHRYSMRSPYYNPNLSQSLILERLIQQSNSNVEHLDAIEIDANITTLRPPMRESIRLYLVQVRIGTGQVSYYLDFDTGSSLTWIQCKPCRPCFNQPNPTFDPAKSPTFRSLRHDDPFCTPPCRPDSNGNCAYQIRYNDEDSTNGVLSKDTFAFKSDNSGQAEVVPNLAFGCSYENRITNMGNHDGLLGMGQDPISLVKQMFDRIGGRFSYCLVKQLSGLSGFLRFGNDFRMVGDIRRTPFHGPGNYFLTLLGITVGERRMHIPPKILNNKNGGLGMDTGTTLSAFIKPVYDAVLHELTQYFIHFGVQRTDGRARGIDLELCYNTPRNHPSVLPQMILHLRGADYIIGWEKLFIFNPRMEFFCLAVLWNRKGSILGAHQQYDVRFEFNLGNNVLSFVPENCAQDAGQ